LIPRDPAVAIAILVPVLIEERGNSIELRLQGADYPYFKFMAMRWWGWGLGVIILDYYRRSCCETQISEKIKRWKKSSRQNLLLNLNCAIILGEAHEGGEGYNATKHSMFGSYPTELEAQTAQD
jgi:hypothetical protein